MLRSEDRQGIEAGPSADRQGIEAGPSAVRQGFKAGPSVNLLSPPRGQSCHGE